VFSFGCGKAPEAMALLGYLGRKMKNFSGFDKNEESIRAAESEIKRRAPSCEERFSFVKQDLYQQLPGGNPDLIIIRHPNTFDVSDEKCKSPSEIWRHILTQAREKYPKAFFLITTLTQKEAQAICQILNLDYSSIKVNSCPTRFERNFPRYGVFKLPVAADQYYILFSQN